MRIKVKRKFRYQVGARTVREIEPGIHDLPPALAEKVLKWGKAEIVKETFRKFAPENKVVEAPEAKVEDEAGSAPVERTPVRRRRSRAKSD